MHTMFSGSKPLRNLQHALAFPQKILADLLLWGAITPLAFLIRFDGALPALTLPALAWFTGVSLLLKLVLIPWFGLNRQSWRHVSLADVMQVGCAISTMLVLQFALLVLLRPMLSIPRSVPVIEFILAILVLIGMRVALRWRHRRSLIGAVVPGEGRRVLVLGAGEAGAMVVRELGRHPELGMCAVGILDDGADKQRLAIDGVPVLGPINDLPALLAQQQIDEVILAIPTGAGDVVRYARQLCADSNVPLRVMPGVFELLNDAVSVSRLREVQIEDLLRREAVPVDLSAVQGYLRGRTVLVTGAGGSIGSELVRQIVRCGVKRVIALGRGENSIYTLLEDLKANGVATEIVPVITDMRDGNSVDRAFAKYKPQVVFHAAAHKHVPLMEANPEQAVLNNLGGTQNVTKSARKHGVERFVNISTDKAVNPTSVMGATKRLAEQAVMAAADGEHKYVSVRFGNVLGSRGSVVPRFKAQIEAGGPVEVTHRDMIRYFMTIPEAVQLVLQAGALAEPGAVYFLDMGEPVRIMQLAEDLIQLSGLTPHKDIKIVFTGMRPGEKLYEELVMAGEETRPTSHPKVFITTDMDPPVDVEALFAAAKVGNREDVLAALKEIVPFSEDVLVGQN